jgi:hypothetical protein
VLHEGTGTDSFHDCVLGPDGWLYVANGTSILRLNVNPDAEDLDPESLSAGVQVRGLGFNVTTLYFTTDGTAVYKWLGQELTNGAKLTFPGSPQALPFTIGTSGQGVVFDVQGNMVLASNGSIHKSIGSPGPTYTTASAVTLSGTPTPFGVAVTTCKEIVFADASTNKILRVTNSGTADTGVVFDDGNPENGVDIPRYIEIASNNDLFIVTSQGDGLNGKVWYADFEFETGSDCPSSLNTTAVLVDLQNDLDADVAAMGIALAATHNNITKTFDADNCTRTYDFGYHQMRLSFTDCAAAFGDDSADINVEALKSTLGEVDFHSIVFPNTPIEGVRISAMGGFPVQYKFTLDGEEPFDPFPTPIQTVFFFNTQEIIQSPGVARVDDDVIDTPYNEDVTSDYWAVPTNDPAGARGDDISKRVVFNTITAGTAAGCTLTFDPPFLNGNPQYNAGQSATIKVTAKNLLGQPCVGATIRISVVANPTTTFDVLNVQSKSNEVLNIMSPTAPGKYIYHLDTTGYPLGTHTVTFWGDVAPTNKNITIGKSK